MITLIVWRVLLAFWVWSIINFLIISFPMFSSSLKEFILSFINIIFIRFCSISLWFLLIIIFYQSLFWKLYSTIPTLWHMLRMIVFRVSVFKKRFFVDTFRIMEIFHRFLMIYLSDGWFPNFIVLLKFFTLFNGCVGKFSISFESWIANNLIQHILSYTFNE